MGERAVSNGLAYRVGVMEAGRRWKDEEIPKINWNQPHYSAKRFSSASAANRPIPRGMVSEPAPRQRRLTGTGTHQEGALRTSRPPLGVVLPVMTSMLSGCSGVGAPSFELFGAFFPAWMLCALIGIIGAVSAGAVLTTPTLNGVIPFQLAVCTAVGVIVALLVWLVLFR